MASNDDRFQQSLDSNRNAPRYRGMSWAWGALVVVIIAIVALYAFDWYPGRSPDTTGAIRQPATPTAPSAPAAPSTAPRQ
jgi:hypothetical protein